MFDGLGDTATVFRFLSALLILGWTLLITWRRLRRWWRQRRRK